MKIAGDLELHDVEDTDKVEGSEEWFSLSAAHRVETARRPLGA